MAPKAGTVDTCWLAWVWCWFAARREAQHIDLIHLYGIFMAPKCLVMFAGGRLPSRNTRPGQRNHFLLSKLRARRILAAIGLGRNSASIVGSSFCLFFTHHVADWRWDARVDSGCSGRGEGFVRSFALDRNCHALFAEWFE